MSNLSAQVASFTDAWIETDGSISVFCDEEVASFTDAWIETLSISQTYISLLSHLLQMRGLKQKLGDLSYSPLQVASFTDAWIETKN